MEAGLSLRQAMFLNGVLYNSEAWHSIDDKDLIPLEKADEVLLRGLLSAHSKTPIEALYLETNSLPVRFILKSRRIMYLHNILQKNPSEMIRKIYETQKQIYSAGDFYIIVTNDMSVVGINLSEEEHEGVVQVFTLSVTGTYHKDSMLRQISKAITIKREDQRILMNTRNKCNAAN